MLLTPFTPLSEREVQVLQLVAKGEKSVDIAKRLGISKYTVDNHRKNMLRKTNTSNSMELVLWAVRNGLLN